MELIVVKHALMRRQVSNFRIGFCGACPRLRSWFTARKHGQRHAEIIGGPVAAALGATAGALVGLSADLLNRGADTDFIEKVARELSPGKVAIVAEVPEDRMDDFHARMEDVGGTVVQCG